MMSNLNQFPNKKVENSGIAQNLPKSINPKPMLSNFNAPESHSPGSLF